MRKAALLALVLAVTLLLGSCTLIVKDQAVDDATEIIRLGDEVITKKEVVAQADQELLSMAYLYSMYGYSYDVTNPDNIASAREEAVESMKKDLVLTAKAKELGLDQLSEEELKAVQEEAQDSFDGAVDYYRSALGDTEGMEEDAILQAAAEKLKEEEGVTLETYVESSTKGKIDDKLREYVVKDVTVTDEEIQADFDSKVAADKEEYAEAPGSWATAANNDSTLYYAPAGVRRVKQILTKFHEEDQTAIDEAKQALTDATTARNTAQAKVDSAKERLEVEGLSEEDKAQADADMTAASKELEDADRAVAEANQAVTDATDKAFANLDEEVDAILASLDAEGADWQAIMDEKNQDPGMQGNEKGYAVAEGMTGFDSAFVDAALALEKIGDHSGKVKGTSYGYYIIRYDSDEPEGPISLDAVIEDISSDLLKKNQDSLYDETVEKWVSESGIKVDLNALKD